MLLLHDRTNLLQWSSYEYRARYYDPSVGRFISEDPLGFIGGIDLYAYVENRPTNAIDSLGLKPWDKQRCQQRITLLIARAGTFLADFAKYNPVTDGAGGWPWRNVPQGTSGIAKPGSHFKNLKDLQDGIKKRFKEYTDNCNDQGPTPPCVKEAIEKEIPSPISPPTDFEIERMIDAGNHGVVGWGAVGVAGILTIDVVTAGGGAAPTAPLLRLLFAF